MAEAFNTRHSCRSPGFICDDGRRIVRIWNRHEIDREILGRLAEARTVIGCVSVAIDEHLGHNGLRFRGRRIRVQQILIANDQHSFRQSRHFLIGALDSFDDERARRSTQNLHFTESVNVGMVPIQSGRLVGRNAKAILERRIARADGRLQDVVLMANRRNGQPMEMKIGRRRRHGAARAWVPALVGMHVRMR